MHSRTEKESAIDKKVLLLLSEEETELEDSGIDEEILSESIRRLYLAGKISKRKSGSKIYYKLAPQKDGRAEASRENTESPQKKDSRNNISRMAEKFRSGGYKVSKGYIASNGVSYPMVVKKEDVRFLISYISDASAMKPEIFSKMLENDSGIRIVVPDTRTKLEVAKIFDVFVRNSYGEQESLLSFNREHSFRVLTVDQFFQKTTWKNLLR